MGALDDLAEDLAAQARILFSHLPEGQIGDDDPLEFRQAPDYGLMVRHDGVVYFMREGAVFGVVELGKDQVDVSAWQGGTLLGRYIGPVIDDPSQN